MPIFQILCLANSQKHGGRCIAGLRNDGQGWVRPVLSQPNTPLLYQQYQLPDGGEPLLLDILEIEFRQKVPQVHHPENWLISNTPWRLSQRFNEISPQQRQLFVNLFNEVVTPGPKLLDNFDNKISYLSFFSQPARSSLALVKPENLVFKITCPENHRKVKANFSLSGHCYCLSVTDPVFKAKLEELPLGDYPAIALTIPDFNPQAVFFTISLSEPFSVDQYCYKLVAAVLSF